jgi:hypothetical protein
MPKVTLRSDRTTDYTFTYKGEEMTLAAGSVIDIADGLTDVVLPTSVMKIIRGVIVIKEDTK